MPKPLGAMRLPIEQAVTCLRLLLDGMSIRATERFTGVNRDTLCNLILTVGEQCERFLKVRMKGVQARELEIDETWAFVAAKQKTCEHLHHGPDKGDAYSFIAMERGTKLIVCHMVAKRDDSSTAEFIRELSQTVTGEFQISTDGWSPYRSCIPVAFRQRPVHFAQIVKVFETPKLEERRKYSPPAIVRVEKFPVMGSPDTKKVSTSIVERGNLTLRMACRRWGRLTSAHSKSWKHHSAAMSLFVAWYNYVRIHSTLKTTPAVAHGIAVNPWTLEELVKLSAAV